jgi:hypothetical protein
MKRTAMVLLVFAALGLTTGIASGQVAAATAGDQVAAAAAPVETPAIPATAVLQNLTAPTYADQNCAGFITSEAPSKKTYVSGGWDTPHSTKYADRDYIYLSGGGVQVNSLYTILRHIQDPNKYPAFKNQSAVAAVSGEPYAEIAHVRVLAVRGAQGGRDAGHDLRVARRALARGIERRSDGDLVRRREEQLASHAQIAEIVHRALLLHVPHGPVASPRAPSPWCTSRDCNRGAETLIVVLLQESGVEKVLAEEIIWNRLEPAEELAT